MFRSVFFDQRPLFHFVNHYDILKFNSKRVRKPLLRRVVLSVISNYFGHSVSRNAAALAYYLIFALFPLLIFVSSLLGMLELDVRAITGALSTVLPRDIVQLLETYLEYAALTSNGTLLGFSLIFSVYFPMRTTKCLMNAVRQAYHLQKPDRPVAYLVYTVVLFAVIALTLFVSTAGPRVLRFAAGLLPETVGLTVSDVLLKLWQYLRFLLLAVVMFAALGALYALSQDRRQPAGDIIPGALAALTAWLTVSIGFSFYVENIARYSVIYGALGAVIVLLVWLYLTAVILILGAELNAVLRRLRLEKER